MITLLILGGLAASPADTISRETTIDEVVVSSSVQSRQNTAAKGRTASIDEHLLRLGKVDVVRRGSYAWEPVVNNMQSERLSTTIDGMKIFYACTDKMDPVTSYVESGNLQRISLNSGLDGNPQATGNIGGSIDLKLRRVGFDAKHAEYNASAGFESNGAVQAYGIDAAFSTHRFYTNFGVFYRHADNYKAGGGEVVSFSQFSKVNAFANLGWQPRDNHIVEGTVIVDVATDIGYPALTMDVKDARGFITSLSYRRERIGTLLNRWETKLYYNRITHNMDDTKRPDVKIHMDMPGKSKTAGLYSLLQGGNDRHFLQLNLDAYYNTLFADMTMYPRVGKPMYMLTWPDVRTFNTGVALTDDVTLGERHHVRLSAKAAWQNQRIHSDEGFKALSIYFPTMHQDYSHLIGRLAASYAYEYGAWRLAAGTGYGTRAPTVTEGYGYFLNNVFDQYDYIGNPHLRNEKAVELNLSAAWSTARAELKAEGNAFFFSDYIIGRPDDRFSPMTIGAAGVKVYQNLSSAQIVNATLTAAWSPFEPLRWENRLTYSYGRESTGARLPLIAPLTYVGTLRYTRGSLEAEAGVRMASRNSRCGTEYGETPTSGYAVWHVNAAYLLRLGTVAAELRAGVENIFDRHYSTYSDWNHIPQKGRSVYANVTLQF